MCSRVSSAGSGKRDDGERHGPAARALERPGWDVEVEEEVEEGEPDSPGDGGLAPPAGVVDVELFVCFEPPAEAGDWVVVEAQASSCRRLHASGEPHVPVRTRWLHWLVRPFFVALSLRRCPGSVTGMQVGGGWSVPYHAPAAEGAGPESGCFSICLGQDLHPGVGGGRVVQGLLAGTPGVVKKKLFRDDDSGCAVWPGRWAEAAPAPALVQGLPPSVTLEL